MVFGALSLALALNAWRPTHWWPLRGMSFAAQLVIGELAPWVMLAVGLGGAWLAVGVGVPPLSSQVGLGLCVAAELVLLRVISLSLGARASVDAALKSAGLAPVEVGPGRWRRALLPRFLNNGPVERIGDVRYAEGAGSRRLLDVYRKRASDLKGAPVLLQIHGGAWVVGSKRTQAMPLLKRMAGAGWVCVSINYRLSPRARFPDHLIDCKLALKWIREHIAEYGGDPARVVVTGGSAGGHLAALVALTQNDPAFQPGFETADTSVMAAVPVYGPFDLDTLLVGFNKRLAGWFSRGVFGVDLRRASPVTHVRPGLPPMLIIQGTDDNLVPAAIAHTFIDAVRAAGNQNVIHLELPGAAHAFDIFHSIRSEAVVSGIHCYLQSLAR